MDTAQVIAVSHEDSGTTEVTVIEVAKPDAATAPLQSQESVVEEIIDAILDPFSDDETTIAAPIDATLMTPSAAASGADWVAPDTVADLTGPLADEATVTGEPTAPSATEATSTPGP